MIEKQHFKPKGFMLTILVLTLVLTITATTTVPSQPYHQSVDFTIPINEFNINNVKKHVKQLSSYQSRFTGYPGFYAAADYIVQQLKEMGVKPYGADGGYYEYFYMTIPYEERCIIKLEDGEEIRAYTLYPNDVNPSPYTSPKEGDKLVYVGKGRLEDYAGIDVKGKFVLMEFNSFWMFRLAMMMGAKGVIFIEPLDTTQMEALAKIYALPVNFPKLYVKRKDGLLLKKLCEERGEVKIWVDSYSMWRKVKVANIVGYIPGKIASERPESDEIIILASYYDAWSITPGLAPGATDALGVSVLLEIARILTKHQPYRSVEILILAGHWQSLWGAREYVDRHFHEIGRKLKLFIGLDMSSGSDKIGLFVMGGMYSYVYPDQLKFRFVNLLRRIFPPVPNSYLVQMQRLFGPNFGVNVIDCILYTYPTYVANWPPKMFGVLLMDSEPFTMAAFSGGVSFVTVDDVAQYRKTPLDVFERINFFNIEKQAKPLTGIIWGIVNEKILPASANPQRTRFHDYYGIATVNLTLVKYNPVTGFHDPVTVETDPEVYKEVPVIEYKQAYVAETLDVYGVEIVSAPVFFVSIIDIPNKNGTITLKSIKPYQTATVYGYVINKTNGRIEYATDLGVYTVTGGNALLVTSEIVNKPIPIFRCSSLLLMNLVNPQDLSYSLTPVVLNFIGHTQLIHRSQISSPPDYMFFVEPNTPVEIVIYTGGGMPQVVAPTSLLFVSVTGMGGGVTGAVFGLLVNATPERPEGWGYILEPGEMFIISFTPAKVAEEYYTLVKGRVDIALRYSTSNPLINTYFTKATEKLSELAESLLELRFDKVYGVAYTAWAYVRTAYSGLMDLIYQVILTLVFFFAISLPFIFFFERLVLSLEGLKRILAIIIMMAAFMITLVFIHPGFRLATNSIMVLLSFSILIVLTPIVIAIFGRAVSGAKSLRSRVYLIHEAEISRVSLLFMAFSVGLQNLRKRPFRTILTITSIALVVVALVSFTSIAVAPIPRLTLIKSDVEPPYAGLLIRTMDWSPIPIELYLQLKSELADKALVIPRAWTYPTQQGAGVAPRMIFTYNYESDLEAFMAMAPEEINATKLDRRILIEGRWFTDRDMYVCLLSDAIVANLSRELGRPITVGSQITVWGVNLTVIGIFDGELLFNVRDIDNDFITPIVWWLPTLEHLHGNVVAIIPFKLAWKLLGLWGNGVTSIAIVPYNPEDIEAIAEELAYRITISNVYFTKPKENGLSDIYMITTRQWYAAIGVRSIIIPLIIAALTIMNLMLGAVYERTREISIYAALGLSPLHVSGMFLAEAVALAILGAVPGYILGVLLTSFSISIGMYPENFFPNFSSIFVVWATLMAIGFAILSSIYPSLKASKLVVPSLIRKWKPVRPVGNEWTIPLPFTTTKDETYGILAFIGEYLESYSGEGSIFRLSELKFEEHTLKVGPTTKHVLRTLAPSMRLAPFDLGIIQDLSIEAVSMDNKYQFTIYITKQTGLRDPWIRSNEVLILNLRKQFLLWRTLSPRSRKTYIEKGKNAFKVSRHVKIGIT